jgi:excinuclease ABC subunit B
MRRTVGERKQVAYNLANGIDPQPIRKKIATSPTCWLAKDVDTDNLLGGATRAWPSSGSVAWGQRDAAQARRLAGHCRQATSPT